MKSLHESLLDDEDDLIDNTDFIKIIKKINNIKKPYIPSYVYAEKTYDVWHAWLKIFDCIYGNFKDIPEIQVRICIYALANWMPNSYISNPDESYFINSNAYFENAYIDKRSIIHFNQQKYDSLKKHLINIALSEKSINTRDVEYIINEVFSKEFIEMAGDENLAYSARQYLTLINNKLVEVDGFDYIQFMKKNHLAI